MSSKSVAVSIVGIGFLLLLPGLLWADENFVVYIRGLNCTSYAGGAEVTKCDTKPMNRTRNEVEIYGKVLKNYTSVFIQVELFRKMSGGYKPFLINVKEDYCKYQAGKGKNFVIGTLFNMIKDTATFPKCPFKENDVFGSTFFFKLENKFPILPQGLYRLHVTFYCDDVKVLQVRALGDYNHLKLIKPIV